MLTSTLPRWAGDAEPGFILDLARELNTGLRYRADRSARAGRGDKRT
jgi:hypothetical protein